MTNPPIRYEWDESKRQANHSKHGIDFAEAERLDWGAALSIDHIRDAEKRTLTYAPIDNRLYAAIWTKRGAVVRLISFRKANSREVEKYEKAQAADDSPRP